jgi:SAM-dependent methyltransferase
VIGPLYQRALREGAAVQIEYADGRRGWLGTEQWIQGIEGDGSLLARCSGPTLDIGSGPGRLTLALTRRGVPALGIDITPAAVELTRRAGAPALCVDVFTRVPGAGKWSTALLADGNIGIGGHPGRLLTRVRELVRPGGRALVELAPPDEPSGCDLVRLRGADSVDEWFLWATLSISDVGPVAERAGFGVVERWEEAGRWFAALG